jgi:hypothetical protein
MRVILYDVETEQLVSTTPAWDFDEWWWYEGNGTCDCNRALLFGHQDDTSGVCLGYQRYLIVQAETTEYSLDELNEYYAPALRSQARHIAELLASGQLVAP